MDSRISLCAAFFSFPLCTQSVPLPVLLQHIISSVTVGSKAPCLEVHIQSCRLKQIAICMPLRGKKQGGAPSLIQTQHLAEYSLFEHPNLCFSSPPAGTVKAQSEQSQQSVFPRAKPIGKLLPKQKNECPVIMMACDLVVLGNGCLDHLFNGWRRKAAMALG